MKIWQKYTILMAYTKRDSALRTWLVNERVNNPKYLNFQKASELGLDRSQTTQVYKFTSATPHLSPLTEY